MEDIKMNELVECITLVFTSRSFEYKVMLMNETKMFKFCLIHSSDFVCGRARGKKSQIYRLVQDNYKY